MNGRECSDVSALCTHSVNVEVGFFLVVFFFVVCFFCMFYKLTLHDINRTAFFFSPEFDLSTSML